MNFSLLPRKILAEMQTKIQGTTAWAAPKAFGAGKPSLLEACRQGFELGVCNWQSRHVGESGAFSGLIGAGTGTVGSMTPIRLFTQSTWYAHAGSGAAFDVHDQLLK